MSLDCFCDYDPADVYSSRIQMARKDYHCAECGSGIKAGERYEYVFGVWDGINSTFRTCERCYDLRMWVKNNVPCFCWAHGSMLNDARDAVEAAADRAPQETVGLRFGFLRRREMNRRYRPSHVN